MRVSVVIFALLGSGACTRTEEPGSGSLRGRLIKIGLEQSANKHNEDFRRELSRVVELAKQRLESSGDDPIDLLNNVLFGELGFVREVEKDETRFMLLPGVLSERRGSCVGLAQLYLLVADELGLKLSAVMAPGHLFVRRVKGTGHTNVEMLRRGESMPDAWYVKTYGVPEDVQAYMRPLTGDETIAVLEYNLGNAERRRRHFGRALAHYTSAVRLFDGMPEAHASRALTFQLLGDLDAARVSYQRAKQLRPSLPGLAENLKSLEAEP